MTSPKRETYPIIGIPVEVFDIYRQCVDEHHAPTVNIVLQNNLSRFVEGEEVYLALFARGDELLFEHSEIKRVRLTQGLFDLVRCLQTYFAREHGFYVSGSVIMTSLVLQVPDDVVGTWAKLFREEEPYRAVGVGPGGIWTTWDNTEKLWNEGKYLSYRDLKTVVDGLQQP
jgi:hypothetical protein